MSKLNFLSEKIEDYHDRIVEFQLIAKRSLYFAVGGGVLGAVRAYLNSFDPLVAANRGAFEFMVFSGTFMTTRHIAKKRLPEEWRENDYLLTTSSAAISGLTLGSVFGGIHRAVGTGAIAAICGLVGQRVYDELFLYRRAAGKGVLRYVELQEALLKPEVLDSLPKVDVADKAVMEAAAKEELRKIVYEEESGYKYWLPYWPTDEVNDRKMVRELRRRLDAIELELGVTKPTVDPRILELQELENSKS